MNSKFRFIDLFAGIGGIRIPFEEVGGKCVFSSEWDKFAQKTYEANFGETPRGNITEINEKDIPKHDLLAGGFPCQAFSQAGLKKGFKVFIEFSANGEHLNLSEIQLGSVWVRNFLID